MKKIRLTDKASINQIGSAMKNKETFIIITEKEKFNPLGYDQHTVDTWLKAVGNGLARGVGVALIAYAIFSPEPATKTGAAVIGVGAIVLAGGGCLVPVIKNRSNYNASKNYNSTANDYEWTMTPKA